MLSRYEFRIVAKGDQNYSAELNEQTGKSCVRFIFSFRVQTSVCSAALRWRFHALSVDSEQRSKMS